MAGLDVDQMSIFSKSLVELWYEDRRADPI